MIDQVKIYVKAGDGGTGVVSFRREKFVPFGGPDGGNGSEGGSIYVVGDQNEATLSLFRYRKHLRAGNGGNGRGKNMQGKKGKDLEIKVPLGTVVRCLEENSAGVIIADIIQQEQRVLVARGGRGGWGNSHFVSSTDQAPHRASKGEVGEERWLQLDLKLIADVGIVGYPNVGKSTLLRAVSRATPKVADYPFTTTEPVLGMVEIGYQSFVLADIPGLIEGAHEGRGLGLDFLRHIERTKVLLYLLDGSSPNPLSDLRKVEAELVLYKADLESRPRVIAVNKIDLPEVQRRLSELGGQLRGLDTPLYFISAATGEGVGALMNKVMGLVSKGDASGEKIEAEFKVFRPRPLSPRRVRQRWGGDE